nr:MAG TPA: hypothetical protein [Caudoviricetes sp.]
MSPCWLGGCSSGCGCSMRRRGALWLPKRLWRRHAWWLRW